MLTSKPLLIFLATLSLNTPLLAQIVTDGTLGIETSLTGSNIEIPANLGQQPLNSNNLFHSFKEFNINTGQTATFTGPDTVQNILTRVTGGQRSFIDGTLRSEIPNANFYLLNPNGIMFGENAKLDVSGSFHASTADVLHLKDGGRFDAVTPDQSQLTVASPEAFGFLKSSPAAISIQGNQSKLAVLEVSSEQTLSLIGGDLTIQDGVLRAPSGHIQLVALASAGKVFQTADNLAIIALGELGKISVSLSGYKDYKKLETDITARANLDVSGKHGILEGMGTGPGGQIVIRGGQFLLDQGRILANTYSGIGGDIDIEVTDKISLENSTQISARNLCRVGKCESSQGGDIRVTTRHLSFSGWSEDYKNYLSKSNRKEVERKSLSRIDTNYYSSGRGGDIRIQAEVLELSPGVLETMDEVSENTGLPGNIEVNAQQVILLTGGGNIYAATHSRVKAGQITINSPELSLFDSSFITASSDSSRVAGDIEINSQRLILEESWMSSFNVGTGDAGTIHILQAESIFMADNSAISTQAVAAGGGDITIDVNGNLFLNNSFISASARGDKPGHGGGNLTIGHPNLLILENSQLFARAINGEGGKIKVQANYFIHSYPFEEKEYFTEFGSQTLDEKISQGFTLIDASSEKSRPGEVRMEAKEWTFAGPQPLPIYFQN